MGTLSFLSALSDDNELMFCISFFSSCSPDSFHSSVVCLFLNLILLLVRCDGNIDFQELFFCLCSLFSVVCSFDAQ